MHQVGFSLNEYAGRFLNTLISFCNVNCIAFTVLNYAYAAHNACIVYYPFLVFM